MERIETAILSHLINNDEYTRKVLPYLKDEYFQNKGEQIVFKIIDDYVRQYNVNPSPQIVSILLNETKMAENDKDDTVTIMKSIQEAEQENLEWLIDATENFCKQRAIWNSIMLSAEILNGEAKDKTLSQDAIPGLLEDALSICFDPSIGHDYVEDSSDRFEAYGADIKKIPFDIDMFNKITRNGLVSKSLTIFLAGCIHPDTTVKLKVGDIEIQEPIKSVKRRLKEGELVYIDSPDGWVKINKFIQKGQYDEYCLNLDDGRFVRCNGDHLFETTFGWQFAKDLALLDNDFHFLTDSGYVLGFVHKVEDSKIPIVDIEVDHENHRYYANGISSHNTGVGKSMIMCHMAAAALAQSKNVLYITLEMSEEMIAERIDANLFDIDISKIRDTPRDVLANRILSVQKKTQGKLIIKEYPTGTAHAGHFKTLLNELKLKKKFEPDLIFVDYINICSSQRHKGKDSSGSYQYIKSISEELRALAVEFDLPLISSTQLNRQGFSSSDVSMTDTSESFGLNFTADLAIAAISSEELEKLNQMMFKQLKNRYNDPNYYNKFVVGIDRSRMRLFDCETRASNELVSNRTEEVTASIFQDLTKGSKNFSKLKV